MPDCLAVIPARFSSTRLPGKPLARIADKSLIRHVYENAVSTKLFSQVIVATDDERIKNEVEKFEGKVFLSRKKHNSGSDRIAEVAQNYKADIIFNIQGDEFNLSKKIFAELLNVFEDEDTHVATPVFPLKSKEDIFDPNQVKVVINNDERALYFSRSVIPYNRSDEDVHYWGHVGVYAFRRDILFQFAKLKQSSLEKTEKLEQLRLLENGFNIRTIITDYKGISIDTKQDLQKAREFYKKINK